MDENNIKRVKSFLKINNIEAIQLKAFDFFCKHSIKKILEGKVIDTNDYKIIIKNVFLEPPELSITECLKTLSTYSSVLYANIDCYYKNNNNSKTYNTTVTMGEIPIMVGSCMCKVKPEDLRFKCYFIIKGLKKYVTAEERISFNSVFLLAKKKEFNFKMYVEFKSINNIKSSFIDIGLKNNKIMVYCPDIFQKELIGIYSFLLLFLSKDSIKKYNNTIFEKIDHKFHTKLAEIMVSNFDEEDIKDFSNEDAIKTTINDKFLIHMKGSSLQKKGKFIFYLLSVLYKGILNITSIDNRDHYGNKRIYNVCTFLSIELMHVFEKKFKKKCIKVFNETGQLSNEIILKNFEKCCDFTTSLKGCLTMNTWIGKITTNQNVSQIFDCFNELNYYDNISKINTPIKNENNKVKEARDFDLTQSDIMCPFSTPDGKKVGLIKHFSMQAHLSLDNSIVIDQMVRSMIGDRLNEDKHTPLFVNGNWLGSIDKDKIDETIAILLKLKTVYRLFDISIYYNHNNESILVHTDAGRIMYPIVLKPFEHTNIIHFKELLAGGYIAYMDKNEMEMYKMDEKDIFTRTISDKSKLPFDFLFPACLGYIGTMTPFSNHNQSPRNIYQCQMSKQAISGHTTVKDDKSNVNNILVHAQTPIVNTIFNTLEHTYINPTGFNVIMALMPFYGENQEDSLILNKSSVDRGLFLSERETTHTHILESDDILWSPIINPQKEFLKLVDGIVKVGSILEKNDVMICLKKFKVGPHDNNFEPYAALKHDSENSCRVKSVTFDKTSKNDIIIRVTVVEFLIPAIGDKFCLTDDHQVLTSNGWKGIADVTLDDEVCCMDASDETIVYEKPSEVVSFECENETLYEIDTQYISLMTTMNHRMFVKTNSKNSVYRFVDAQNCLHKRLKYKKNAKGGLKHTIDLDDIKYNDFFLQFLGIFMSEGWCCGGCIIISSCKDRIKKQLLVIERKLNWNFNKSTDHKWYVCKKRGPNNEVIDFFKNLSIGAINKSLPNYVFKLCKKKCIILLNALISGDGHISHGCHRYSTSSTKLKDDMQTLALHCGFSSNASIFKKKGTEYSIKSNINNRISVGTINADSWYISILKRIKEPLVNSYKIQDKLIENFSGKVYCLTTKTGLFYVRRHGKTVWSGNSSRHGKQKED
uniref:DNA-directed RNA polymerase n=1 Tax=viral metagenome TaxID=1070528 RepID=A0A6C0JBE8_9ZZZZ